MEKFNWKARLTNPATYVAIISLVTLIFSTANIPLENINTWGALYNAIVTILSNPYILFSIVGVLVGVGVDTSSKGFLDKKQKVIKEINPTNVTDFRE